MSNSPKTSLIIPAYYANQALRDMTERCVKSLGDDRPDEVLVIDDTDGDGYAATVNRGLATATGDVLIIANNDIEFAPGWLGGILKPLREGYDISSIKTNEQDPATHDTITEGDKFGSIWAMTRHAYTVLGPLDESFGRGYYEDTDYWRRAKENGLRVGKNHAIVVKHKGKATFSVVDPGHASFGEAERRYIAKWGEVE